MVESRAPRRPFTLLLVFLLGTILPFTVRADRVTGFQIYACALFEEAGHYISSSTGGPDVFPMPTAAIGASYVFNLSGSWGLAPDFHGSIPVTHGSGASSYILSVGAPFVYNAHPLAHFLMGLSLDMKGVYGGGGPSTQNNGGSTATYYKASKNVIAMAPAMVLGITTNLGDKWMIRAITHILVPLSNTRRQFNVYLGLGHWF